MAIVNEKGNDGRIYSVHGNDREKKQFSKVILIDYFKIKLWNHTACAHLCKCGLNLGQESQPQYDKRWINSTNQTKLILNNSV